MELNESKEMYLETIYVLSNEQDVVRSIDIANEMNITRASVSKAIKQLRLNEWLEIDEHGYIQLLPKGEELAKSIYERHIILTKLLKHLGIDADVAAQDACKIEHVISEESFTKIKAYLNDK